MFFLFIFKKIKKTGRKQLKGQLLLELLIAIFIFAIVSLTFVTTINTALNSNKYTSQYSAASALLSELQEKIRAVANSDWNSLYNTTRAPCNDDSCHYKIIKNAANNWEVQQGEEEVSLNGVNYTRYFEIYDVKRDSDGAISELGTTDPLTLKVVAYISWSGKIRESKIYVSRSFEEINSQTDWSGGVVGDEVSTQSTSTFATSSQIDYYTTSGQIELEQVE